MCSRIHSGSAQHEYQGRGNPVTDARCRRRAGAAGRVGGDQLHVERRRRGTETIDVGTRRAFVRIRAGKHALPRAA